MADVLIAALSPIGHAGPLLTVAEDRVNRGDRVTVMTGSQHRAAIESFGATAHVLPRTADLDDSNFDVSILGSVSPIGLVNEMLVQIFLPPMANQLAELDKAMALQRYDVIISDVHLLGAIALLQRNPKDRPAVLLYTPSPLVLSSRDTAPFGMARHPGRGLFGVLRNRTATLYSQKLRLRRSQQMANAILKGVGAAPLPMFVLDAGVLADRYVVPTVPEFEYPRGDLPANVRYVGPMAPPPHRDFDTPPWWDALDSGRPVVHVTQGTVDVDPARLIEPTISALADEDVVLVVTKGGHDVADIKVPIPANTYVADYLPHDVLLPKVDVMVTNGGYGAVQRALCNGVPLVVAGDTEDKPEVAARVAWSGVGVNLRTGAPTASAVGRAVRDVLNNDHYRTRARRLQTLYSDYDSLAEIDVLIDEVIARRAVSEGADHG